jgi:multicomponent Na+:H+ antiporter subunit D
VSWLVPIPIVLPLVGAGLSVLGGRSRTFQRAVGVTVLVAVVVVSAILLVEADQNGAVVAQAGGWLAPLGITLVADRFATIMLVVGSVMLLAVLVYAIGEPGAERNHVGFQSVYLVLAAGVAGSLLAGDLFNLFVAFEMMLTASYVLLTLGGRRDQIRSGMTYVVISLLASTLFVTAIALLYAAAGTVNMADLAVRLPQLPVGLQSTFAVMLLVVFGIKAALFPLFFWLPDSYPTAPSPIVAVFAGLLTKVGVYAIVRTQTLFFSNQTRPATLILVLAGATMVVGVLGAIAQDDVRRILSFTIVSQIGFMVMGLGFFTVAGLAAVVYAIIHHIIVKTSLFLTGGLIEHAGGSSGFDASVG